jgi:beta-galactosidase
MTQVKKTLVSALIALAGATTVQSSSVLANTVEKPHSFAIHGNQFELDGKPFLIRAGEMHYARVPKEHWRHRMKMLRALGLNTLTTYVFWNLHEPQPETYNFSGQLDIAEYIRTAQEEGLFVILRPGPFVCAEWEFGGMPAWLLKDPTLMVRSSDPRFIAASGRFLSKVGEQVKDLMISKGGPIILTQVENEYGSFGADRDYLNAIRAALTNSGIDGILFTSDNVLGQHNILTLLARGSFPDLPLAINFGQDESAASAFGVLDRFRPEGVRLNSEYWFGWFDHVGGKHSNKDMQKGLDNLKWMLDRKINISIYMAHGGTNFGFMNGATSEHGFYRPDTTSYDYDAPISEAGLPTPKFHAIRALLQQEQPGVTLPPIPPAPKTLKVAPFAFTESAPLDQLLGQPIISKSPKTMEEVDQAYGFILYRHHVTKPYDGMLALRDVRDYAWLRQGSKLLGTLDRRYNQSTLDIHLDAGKPLDILVENHGRLNFTPELAYDRKGITKQVVSNTGELNDWEIYPLPLNNLSALHFTKAKKLGRMSGPTFFRGSFRLAELGDTFIDTRGWGKGVVFVNGHNLGRYWRIGPQKALYCPGSWLQKGNNEIIVFELEHAPTQVRMAGLEKALFE